MYTAVTRVYIGVFLPNDKGKSLDICNSAAFCWSVRVARTRHDGSNRYSKHQTVHV